MYSQQTKRIRLLCAKSIQRLRKGRLILIFETWYVNIQFFIHRRSLLYTIATKKKKKMLYIAYHTFIKNALLLSITKSKYKQGGRRLYLTVSYRLKRNGFHSFKICNDKEEEKKKNNIIVQKIWLIMTRRRMYRAFQGWEKNTSVKIQTRQRLHRVIQRMLHQRLSVSFHQWNVSISMLLHSKLIIKNFINCYNKRKKNILLLSFCKMNQFRLNEKEKENVLQQKIEKLRTVVIHAVRKTKQRVLRSKLLHWFFTVDVMKKNEQKILQTILSMKNKNVKKSFELWYDYTIEIKKMKRQLHQVTAKFTKQLESKLLNTWIHYVDRRILFRNFLR